jgi:hypothetical protein
VDAFGRTAVLVTGAVVIVVTTLASLAVRGVMEYAEPGRGSDHGGREGSAAPGPDLPHPAGYPDLVADPSQVDASE